VRDSLVKDALAGGSRLAIVRAPGGYQKIIELQHTNGRFPVVRISDPAYKSTRLIDVAALRTLALPFRPPAADIRALAGRFEFNDDSVWWKGAHVDLPASKMRGDGAYLISNGDMKLAAYGQPAAFNDFQWVYPHLPKTGGNGRIIATQLSVHYPNAEADLNAYRMQYGLPPCTKASGCFRQVNQHGGTKPEPSGVGTGWDLEATLDVSMISAGCPRCRILVVEGNSPTPADLAATERTAARLGAQVISNSYGTGEDGFSLPFRKAYQPRGHTVVASSGDSGFTDPQFPADLPTVTSVGGTMLSRADTRRGWHERAWQEPGVGAGGSGCSAWIAKPAWQHDTHCPMRTIADISAVASNIPVFNSVYGGWVTVAGTSASAPLVAGIYGLAAHGTTMTTARLYRHRRSFFDITTGSNVFGPPRVICGGDYLCTAKKGYDAPTGLGTPDGPRGL
jgi:hypothetical protein